MLNKRTVDLFNRSLPQRKTQLNTLLESQVLAPGFTNPNSKKFHPYLSSLHVDQLRGDFNHTLAVGITLWKILKTNLLPKKALVSFGLIAFTLLGITSSHGYQEVIVPKGVVLASAQTAVSMSATIVSDDVPNFKWPLFGYITTKYSRWHQGIDVPKPKGTPIHPIAAGTVTVIENSRWGYGKSVIVTHSSGYASRYAHLSTIHIKMGDSVTPETVLGGVGNTGRSTGNHLHMEIYENGKTLNPLNILPQQPSVAAANQ